MELLIKEMEQLSAILIVFWQQQTSKDRLFVYNVTYRRVRTTTIAVEKQ
jgi:hypothetical protein